MGILNYGGGLYKRELIGWLGSLERGTHYRAHYKGGPAHWKVGPTKQGAYWRVELIEGQGVLERGR